MHTEYGRNSEKNIKNIKRKRKNGANDFKNHFKLINKLIDQLIF